VGEYSTTRDPFRCLLLGESFLRSSLPVCCTRLSACSPEAVPGPASRREKGADRPNQRLPGISRNTVRSARVHLLHHFASSDGGRSSRLCRVGKVASCAAGSRCQARDAEGLHHVVHGGLVERFDVLGCVAVCVLGAGYCYSLTQQLCKKIPAETRITNPFRLASMAHCVDFISISRP